MALVWLLLRVRWRRAFAQSLAVALLIGAVGGFVLASAAAARRVESAYSTFIDEIDAPDVGVIPAEECGPVNGTGCDGPTATINADDVLADLRATAVVEEARLVESVIPFIIDAEGTPIFGTVDDVNACYDGDRSVQMLAAQPGGPTAQVVPFTLEGELPSPGSGTLVVTRSSAAVANLAIGDEVLLGGWCNGDGDPVRFDVPISLRLSGLAIGPLDVEAPGGDLTIHPAFVDPLAFDAMVVDGAKPQQTITLWLDPTASEESVAASLSAYLIIIDFRERTRVFDDALTTDANLLWLLAAVGALSGLLVLGPVIGRNVRDSGPNTETLAALGVRRSQIAHQAIAHGCSLALIGALSAAAMAVPISALMPQGLASAINPNRELWFDGVSTLIGVVLLIIVVAVIGALPAWKIGRAARTDAQSSERGGGVTALVGLRPAARSGVSAAVGTPVGLRRASPWPSLISMMVAAVVGVASLTYLAGLRHLEQTPRLVGWNWDAVVSFDFDQGDPSRASEILTEIEALDAVEAATAGTFYPPWFLFVPGHEVSVWPWSFDTGPDAIAPSMLHGRAPEGPDEVAIDASFASQTGLGIGDTVTLARTTLITLLADELPQRAEEFDLDYEFVETPEQAPVVAEFDITGIVVTPSTPAVEFTEVTLTIAGFADLVEPEPDEVATARAWLPDDLPPILLAQAEDLFANLDIEDRVAYLRFTGSVQAGAAAVAGIEGVPEVVAPTPEQVLSLMVGLNIERNDRVPVALAIMVAVAFFALASYLLFFAIRARRFEMAVMRALGLSTRGIRWSVAAQATATALVALIISIPVGVLVGRWAWLEYARDLGVLPVSIMPWSTLALIAAGAIMITNVVALVPGWFATRRSPGHDLRSE